MEEPQLPIFLNTEENDLQSNKVLIQTRTGEPFQPARIYYQVFNRKTVIGAFKKLKCMQDEPRLGCWRWLYDQETKKLKFDIPYNKIEKQYRPIVLGDFFFPNPHEMFLDVRSFDRALQALEFFSKRINRRAAQVTKMRIVNKCFDANAQVDQAHLHPPFDYFFNREDVAIPNLQELELKMKSLEQEYDDEESRMKAFREFLEEKNKQPLPEIEEVPVYMDDEFELDRLKMLLNLKSIEAMQHWQGNTSFSQYDLIQQFVSAFGEEESFDEENDEEYVKEYDEEYEKENKAEANDELKTEQDNEAKD